MTRKPLLLFALTASLLRSATAQEITHPILEATPDDIRAHMQLRDTFLRAIPQTAPTQPSVQEVVAITKLWKPGSTVTVAVQGGSSALVATLIEATRDWTNAGNLTLDFGFNTATGSFRQWSANDLTYAAEIRVGFSEPGYWSVVGNDSDNPTIVPPGRASLNLQGFNIQLPRDFRGVIRHEFGHALGFEHEHQQPTLGCDADFRWENDPGYIVSTDPHGQFIPDANGKAPGIYTVLGGPPNNWPREKVDYNLRQFPPSHMFRELPFDRLSVMKYFFPPWMFVGGTASHCFTSAENETLSDGDKAAMRDAYPTTFALLQQTLVERRAEVSALLQPELPAKTAVELQHALSELH